MLKEFLLKMRGVDRWPEVQATVRSVKPFEEPSYERYEFPRKLADVTFAYTDSQGELQYGCITVNDGSSLYDAKEDETFSIRVNPTHPEEYYSPEATTTYL
ncbi:MAG: hypothetical protein ABSG51_07500 [Terracidiphilus sp.]|jgi:hypothetical protein